VDDRAAHQLQFATGPGGGPSSVGMHADPPNDLEQLAEHLGRLDGRGYRSYREIAGRYQGEGFVLSVDHVQGDPFAAPSRLSLRVDARRAALPAELCRGSTRRRALADFLLRAAVERCDVLGRRRGSGRSGALEVDRPGQQVLERTACRVDAHGAVELRLSAGLPAAGRRILGRAATELLVEDLPRLCDEALCVEALCVEAARRHVEAVEDAVALRAQLAAAGLCAFVADGSILPRRSGVDARPLAAERAVPFASPPSLRVTLEAPNAGAVVGLGLRRGVTLIVGGGYHGKSTLLSALELGVYDHVPGDGRERVLTDPAAVKIRAEDGRRVEGVDISPFVGALPGRGPGGARDTRHICSDDASGSTSQAANVVEALELGATTLLIDEDTAATNFMIRDRRMQELVAKPDEPITPFCDRVSPLHRELGVSTVLVLGGSGDYFDVADCVLAMREFAPHEVTEEARRVAAAHPTGRRSEVMGSLPSPAGRVPLGRSLDARRGRHAAKVMARELREIAFGEQRIDLALVSQLVAPSQLEAIGRALLLARGEMDGQRSLREVVTRVERRLAREGLDILDGAPMGRRALFRRFELGAAINRLRTLEVRR
jgi:predicted ABC-class ATPase